MHTQIKAMQSEGYSQRAISQKLNINRRTVAMLLKMNEEEAHLYLMKRHQKPSGFDIAEDYIKSKILINPNIKKRELYQEILNYYPEIQLTERTFGNYLEKIKYILMMSQLPLKQSEQLTAQNKEHSKNLNPSIPDTDSACYPKLSIGAKINDYRMRSGLSKRELAVMIDVTSPMITYYEKGERQPSLKTLIKIAAATRLPIEYFLSNNDHKHSVKSTKLKNSTAIIKKSLNRADNKCTQKTAIDPNNTVEFEGINEVESVKSTNRERHRLLSQENNNRNSFQNSYPLSSSNKGLSVPQKNAALRSQRLNHKVKESVNDNNEQVIEQVKRLTDEASTLMSSNPDRCIELSKKALQIAQENNYNVGIGLAYAHKGSGHFYHAEYYEALKNYLTAITVFQKENYIDGLRNVYNNIGVVYYQWDELEKALEYYQKNLEMETQDADPRTNSTIMNNIGTIYSRLKNYKKALQFYKDAYQLCATNNIHYGTTLTLCNIGHTYLKLNRFDKADEYLNKAIEIGEKIDNYVGLSKVYTTLTELKNCIGKFDQALITVQKALFYARKLGDQHLIARIYLQFANLYEKINKPMEQKSYTEKCIAIAEPNNYRVTALSAYKMLAKINEKRNDFQASLTCLNKIQQINDYINDEKRTRDIEEIKTKLEVERTEREKDILRQKNSELQRMNQQIVQQKKQLENTEKELTELNHNLEVRVHQEIERRRQQEQLIIQKSKLESLGQMAAGIAHEINQPLGLIQISNQNLLNKYKEKTMTDEYLKIKSALIFDNITRIKKIIEHIRLFSRDQKVTPERFDVIETINNALSMTRTQFRSQNINILTEITPTSMITLGNKYRLEQVLINLITNAKDAFDSEQSREDKDKQILIRTSSEADTIVIEVEDNGSGIDNSIVQKVFEPFFTTKEENKGTGLGLSICYGIIRDMNGKITIRSEQSRFTIVRIELPLC